MTLGQWLSRLFLGYWIEEGPDGYLMVYSDRSLSERELARLRRIYRSHAARRGLRGGAH